METIERNASEFRQYLSQIGYKRKSVVIKAAETVTLHDLNWSGGTRAEYSVFTIDGQYVSNTLPYSALAPWANRAEGAKLPIPEGFIVVEHGCFCGKPARARIYVHPANMPKLLTAA